MTRPSLILLMGDQPGRGANDGALSDRPLPDGPGADWPLAALDDDVMPAVAALVAAGEPFALVTIVAADGGPRPVGSQMAVSAGRTWGFVSGGCVEADVALQGRAAMAEGRARRVVYGWGSPFIDIRLPCGGRIELLVEPVDPGDPAMIALADAWERRCPARYLSDATAAVGSASSLVRRWRANG